MPSRAAIFNAVFPSAVLTSLLTSTPLVGVGRSEETIINDGEDYMVTEKKQWERAWQVATSFLSLPNFTITPSMVAQKGRLLQEQWQRHCSAEVSNSMWYLVSERSCGLEKREGRKQDDLMTWYSQEVERHFITFQLPELRQYLESDDDEMALKTVLKLLLVAQSFYLLFFRKHITPNLRSEYCDKTEDEDENNQEEVSDLANQDIEKEADREDLPGLASDVEAKAEDHHFNQAYLANADLKDDPHSRIQLSKLQENHNAMVAVSLEGSRFWAHLATFLKKQTALILEPEPQQGNVEIEVAATSSEAHQLCVANARRKTIAITELADKVGLGGSKAQRVFAEVMSAALTDHVNSVCAGNWTKGSLWVRRLREWVQTDFTRFAVEVLSSLEESVDSRGKSTSSIMPADIRSWQERAIVDLGLLRLRELFDIIVDWSGDTSGGIEDLEHYITTAATRTHLVTHFSTVLSQRLLQPGASTTQILQIYVSIIRAFAMLDPKGVLIDRLARPIRRYLRDRDDTVRIVVSGLLADLDSDATTTDALVELAAEVRKSGTLEEENDDDVDWGNTDWTPYPIDAGPDFQKSKSADVIGTLISLFDSKEIFVKEFQNHLGERLLRSERDFEKEIRVLELLKMRFGEGPLQACEVMLRDIEDSHQTDIFVKRELIIPDESPNLSAKILSRLFWPSLHSETFAVPPHVAVIQERYAAEFENHKNSRKLTWLPALGQVEVELQFEDRIVLKMVQTWQASVIYAFQDFSSAQPVHRTVEQLCQALAMDEGLVRNAITFWIGNLVLTESSPGMYSVLERLENDQTTTTSEAPVQASLAAAAASAASVMDTSAMRSAEDMVNEKMEIFWQYIIGMLTNQGQMPLPRIVMMLSLVVPGGFPFANDELREYLAGKVAQGKVELTAGNYKVFKGAL